MIEKFRGLLEIDIVIVRFGQNKKLNRDNEKFVKTYAWKPLFKKIKSPH